MKIPIKDTPSASWSDEQILEYAHAHHPKAWLIAYDLDGNSHTRVTCDLDKNTVVR